DLRDATEIDDSRLSADRDLARDGCLFLDDLFEEITHASPRLRRRERPVPRAGTLNRQRRADDLVRLDVDLEVRDVTEKLHGRSTRRHKPTVRRSRLRIGLLVRQ